MNEITDKKWSDAFAIRLNSIMGERHISGVQLAGLTLLTGATVSRFRNGRRIPSALDVARIADALNCTADELISLKYDEFEMAGFSSAECERLRELSEKYNLDPATLIAAVKYMGPGLTKYKKLDELFQMCSKKEA